MSIGTATMTAADVLRPLLTDADVAAVAGDHLLIEGHPAEVLLADGSPVVAQSARRVRANAGRLQRLFAAHWSGTVRGFYAVKANPHPMVLGAAVDSGYGLECGGPLELAAAATAPGTPAVVVNGSGKSATVVAAAVNRSWHVNVDSPEEARWLVDAGRDVDVCVRLKVIPPELDELPVRHPPAYPDARSYLEDKRWGLSEATAADVLAALARARHVRVRGFSMHVGRVSSDPAVVARFARQFARMARRLAPALPMGEVAVLDVGGGWQARRDPASGTIQPGEGAAPFVAAALAALARDFAARPPQLWFEPGAYLAADAAVLLCRVTGVKVDGARRWVHLDASTTGNLPRHDTSGAGRHVVTATAGLDRPVRPTVVVGAACLGDPFAADALLPDVVPGEAVAILDVGAYGASLQNDFNGYPAARIVDTEVVR